MMLKSMELLAAVLAGDTSAIPNCVGILYTPDLNPGAYSPPSTLEDLATLVPSLGGNVAVARFAFAPARDSHKIIYSASTNAVFTYMYPRGSGGFSDGLDELDGLDTPVALLGAVVLSHNSAVFMPLTFSNLRTDNGTYPVRQPGTDHFISVTVDLNPGLQ